MTPQEITAQMRKCSVGDCEGCPYRYVDDYEAGCGRLLADAALLLSVVYPSDVTIALTLDGKEVAKHCF